MATYTKPWMRAARLVCAVSAITVVPTVSWQILDARSSATVAAPVNAAVVAPGTIIRKSILTWSHTKSDRLTATDRPVPTKRQTAALREVAVPVPSAKADRERTVTAKSNADAGQFSDWLVADESDTGAARIVDFAARRFNSNRTACRARHSAIVSAFSSSRAHIMADRPVMFQSTICAANGEIVITCFGTSATVSPRRARPGSRCSKRG